MSSIDLVILGHLLHGEKSAYEMVKDFEYWNINYWVKISTPSIYKNVIKLYDKGFLNSRVVKEGEMPEKTIYSLNDNGKDYFNQLMQNYSNNIGNIYLEFSAFITNLHELDTETRKKLLIEFKTSAENTNKQIQIVSSKYNNIPNTDAIALIKLYEKIYSIIYEWTCDLLKSYES